MKMNESMVHTRQPFIPVTMQLGCLQLRVRGGKAYRGSSFRVLNWMEVGSHFASFLVVAPIKTRRGKGGQKKEQLG